MNQGNNIFCYPFITYGKFSDLEAYKQKKAPTPGKPKKVNIQLSFKSENDPNPKSVTVYDILRHWTSYTVAADGVTIVPSIDPRFVNHLISISNMLKIDQDKLNVDLYHLKIGYPAVILDYLHQCMISFHSNLYH